MKNTDDEDRAFRGGSWFYGSTYCRASDRFRHPPVYRYGYFGFRVLHRRKP
jgi:formylglycine-generating enzyme required for sulfatase activity